MKITLSNEQFENLKAICKYALSQKTMYLTCLLRSEYGIDEDAVKETMEDIKTFTETFHYIDAPFGLDR